MTYVLHEMFIFFHEINRDLELVFINTRKNMNMINDIEKKLEESIQQKTATDTENKVEQNESADDTPGKDIPGKEETDLGSSDNVHEMSGDMWATCEITCLRGFRKNEFQTNLLSYRD